MLSDRNRVRLRRFGQRLFMRPRDCRCSRGDCINLSRLSAGSEALITHNADLKTIERGLYRGVKVKAFRNDPNEPNLVIAVGDSRYVLDRRIALLIKVRVI